MIDTMLRTVRFHVYTVVDGKPFEPEFFDSPAAALARCNYILGTASDKPGVQHTRVTAYAEFSKTHESAVARVQFFRSELIK